MTAPATVHDPVCHMDVEPDTAAGSSEYGGTTYYFCGAGCKRDFDEDPAGVLAAEAAYDHGRPIGDHPFTVGPTKRPWWRFWS